MHDLRLAERDHVIGAGISGAAEGFAVQALVLEKQHWVVAADGGAQQSGGILRVRWENDAEAGDVRKDTLAALRMVDGAAGQVSADRDANHDGAGESVVRAPADDAELVANLHHRGPDVVEELNLDDWLQTRSEERRVGKEGRSRWAPYH